MAGRVSVPGLPEYGRFKKGQYEKLKIGSRNCKLSRVAIYISAWMAE
jgi:hypothetical protein